MANKFFVLSTWQSLILSAPRRASRCAPSSCACYFRVKSNSGLAAPVTLTSGSNGNSRCIYPRSRFVEIRVRWNMDIADPLKFELDRKKNVSSYLVEGNANCNGRRAYRVENLGKLKFARIFNISHKRVDTQHKCEVEARPAEIAMCQLFRVLTAIKISCISALTYNTRRVSDAKISNIVFRSGQIEHKIL